MPNYYVKSHGQGGLTETSEHFETFHAAQAYATTIAPRVIAIWELDADGNEVGEPHLISR